MAEAQRRRRIIIAIIVLLIVLALLLLLPRCLKEKPASQPQLSSATQQDAPSTTSPDAAPATSAAEALTSATLTAPPQVTAGAEFSVTWTGPDNRGDFVTVVRGDAPGDEYASYQETRQGSNLNLIAPIEPGSYEIRYVTGQSHTILGRAPIEVVAAGATIDAANEVVLGSQFTVAWTGPNNRGDYITIVPKDAPDAQYASYVDADKPSPQKLTAPTAAGEAEVRYVTGQGKKVLARRAIRVLMADATIDVPGEAVAGSMIQVTWTGPNNAGDYITVVAKGTPDGQYANYTNASDGSPLNLLLPIMDGDGEIRYMTGLGHRVLVRRAIRINAAKVTLSAPAAGVVGTEVSVTWTGPSNAGDYITVVAKGAADGQYGEYALTAEGSPLRLKMPREAGDAEIRYMTGQGNKVLARTSISVLP